MHRSGGDPAQRHRLPFVPGTETALPTAEAAPDLRGARPGADARELVDVLDEAERQLHRRRLDRRLVVEPALQQDQPTVEDSPRILGHNPRRPSARATATARPSAVPGVQRCAPGAMGASSTSGRGGSATRLLEWDDPAELAAAAFQIEALGVDRFHDTAREQAAHALSGQRSD